jgi:hypothetical protein
MADDDLSNKEAFDQTTQAVFRGIAEVAKVHPAIAHNEPAKAFLAVFLPVVGLTVSRTAQRFFADRLPRLSEGYAKAFDNDPEKVSQHAKTCEDDSDYHDVMFRTFRTMADAADAEVVETLGYLAGQYTYANKRADNYFRRMGRLLCDLERGDLDDLRAIAVGSHKGVYAVTPSPGGPVDIAVDERQHVTLTNWGRGGTRLGKRPGAKRIFFLLKREGLGTNVPAGNVGGTDPNDGQLGVRVTLDMLSEIISTIAPESI